MGTTRYQQRRWAVGLTSTALAIIGIALAPTSLAQDPCLNDHSSPACIVSQNDDGFLQNENSGVQPGSPGTPAPGGPPQAPVAPAPPSAPVAPATG